MQLPEFLVTVSIGIWSMKVGFTEFNESQRWACLQGCSVSTQEQCPLLSSLNQMRYPHQVTLKTHSLKWAWCQKALAPRKTRGFQGSRLNFSLCWEILSLSQVKLSLLSMTKMFCFVLNRILFSSQNRIHKVLKILLLKFYLKKKMNSTDSILKSVIQCLYGVYILFE